MIALVTLAFVTFLAYRSWRSLQAQARLIQCIKAYQASTPFTNTSEIRNPIWIPLQKGAIPKWLNGVMYRIGPGRYNLGSDNKSYMIKHAFDGMPFMHRVELSAERQAVRYNSRHLAESVERELVQGRGKRMAFFGHVQDLTLWDMLGAALERLKMVVGGLNLADKDASALMVGVTATPNYPVPTDWAISEPTLVAKTDLNLLQKVHFDTLKPERLYNYDAFDTRIKGDLSAAHHQYDSATGEVFNFSLKLGPVPKLTVFSISSAGQVSILAQITHRKLPGAEDKQGQRIRASYIHSFFLTRNYIVIPEYPLYYDGMDFLVTGNAIASMRWDDCASTYFHIVGRRPDMGHVVTLATEGFYSFHGANAWDSVDVHGNPVIELDLCAFPNGDILYQLHTFGTFSHSMEAADRLGMQQQQQRPKGMALPPRRQDTFGDLRRYCLTRTSASFRTLVANIEFVRFSQLYALKPYRYVWGCQFKKTTRNGELERYALVKVDLDTGAMIPHDSPRMAFSEPIFVPRPGDGQLEDDGILVCLGSADEGSYVVVLDAKTMCEVAQCFLGEFHTSTFHGSFVDDQFSNVSVN